MDLSALIFVALAAAWAVYLVPKALKHHEDDAALRSVDGFSDRLRVLARREPVSATEATLVAGGEKAPADAKSDLDRAAESDQAATPSPASRPRTAQARRAARVAAQRRRRVLGSILIALVVVGALGAAGVIALAWTAAPAGLLVAWLVACRLMVRRERAVRVLPAIREIDIEPDFDELDNTDEIPVVAALVEPAAQAAADAADAAQAYESDPAMAESAVGRWAPVAVPLPTYVAKAPASRTVRTIDLDATGVWSSGRNETDSQLAREADEAGRARRSNADVADDVRRASGS